MDDSKEFYTTKEVADAIGVHVITVRRWIKDGLLKASRVGIHLFRISKTDYQEFVKKRDSERDNE